ncbi:MAG: cytochrome c maturation protein CcmE [Methylobacteriaceae bacterium]|nr:cytochrome c maturation protein CcmE [Methylobacteriaceae bacterium]
MTRKGRRLALIGSSLAVVAVALGLVLFAMRSNVTYFFSPAEIVEKNVAPGTRLRVGGLVKEGSVKKESGQKVVFAVTDTTRDIAVTYVGLLPDLFREGQGVVVEGVLDSHERFSATTVLAKHDETYMPREVADSLKKQGHWQGEAKAGAEAGSAPKK